MIEFARADEEDVIRALSHAIRVVAAGSSFGRNGMELEEGKEGAEVVGEGQWERHERVKRMYDWQMVAERTETVYERAMEREMKDVGERLARWVPLSVLLIRSGARRKQ
jgi:phosphatidylinositol glycan class A protein